MEEKKIIIDRAILVGLNADCFTPEETSDEKTLDELEALLETAGGECAGKVLQNKHTPDPHSFIGEGKADEVRQMVQSSGANLVIFDNDLTPSQLRTLEDLMKAPVLDRSALILDIFAQRAKTREGIDALKALAERLLERGLHHVRLCLPYSMGGMVDTLHSQAKVLSCRYEAEGILVEAIMDETLYGRLLPYVTE